LPADSINHKISKFEMALKKM